MQRVNNESLTEIFRDVYRTNFPGGLKRIKAEFYPYRSIRHTVEWTRTSIRVKVSIRLHQAPSPILKILALILLAKVYKKRVDKESRYRYKEYIKQLPERVPKIKSATLQSYKSLGEVYDLRVIFDSLNSYFFEKKLRITHLGWSKKRSYTRLGFFDSRRDLLVISRIFDSPRVPQKVIDYLVYHEMLHINFPSTENNGRRSIHSKEFRSIERAYPDYEHVQKWIKRNLNKL